MPRKTINDKPMTPAERSRRRWEKIKDEIAVLTARLKRYEELYGPLPVDEVSETK
jgi:hypothetical protein